MSESNPDWRVDITPLEDPEDKGEANQFDVRFFVLPKETDIKTEKHVRQLVKLIKEGGFSVSTSDVCRAPESSGVGFTLSFVKN